eukprot:6577-Heterococcus_DN1.PRE.6
MPALAYRLQAAARCSTRLHSVRGFRNSARTFALPNHLVVGMPALSPTMEQGNIGKWNKQVGDAIAPGDVICQVETDKATVDFEAQEDAFVAKLLVAEGANGVLVGQPILITVDEESDVAAFKDYELPAENKPAEEAAPAKEEKPAAEKETAKKVPEKKEEVTTQPKPAAKRVEEPAKEPAKPAPKKQAAEPTKESKTSSKLSSLKWGHGVTQSALHSSKNDDLYRRPCGRVGLPGPGHGHCEQLGRRFGAQKDEDMGDPSAVILCYVDATLLGEESSFDTRWHDCAAAISNNRGICTAVPMSDAIEQATMRPLTANGKPTRIQWLMLFAWQLEREWRQAEQPDISELIASVTTKLSKRSTRTPMFEDYQREGAGSDNIRRVRIAYDDDSQDLQLPELDTQSSTIFEVVRVTQGSTEHLSLAILLDAQQTDSITPDNTEAEEAIAPIVGETIDWWSDEIRIKYSLYADNSAESERLEDGLVLLNGTNSSTDNTCEQLLLKVAANISSNYEGLLSDNGQLMGDVFSASCNAGAMLHCNWEGKDDAIYSDVIHIASISDNKSGLAKALQSNQTRMPKDTEPVQINIFFSDAIAKDAYILAKQQVSARVQAHALLQMPAIEDADEPDPAVNAVHTYPEQERVAQALLDKTRQVLASVSGDRKNIEDYKSLDFLVFVPAFSTLKQQTIARVQAQGLNSQSSENADEQGLMYKNSSAKAFKRFKKKAESNKDVLFVIIADECHWGPTLQGAHDTFINDQQLCSCPNVVVLLVSATPYNCLTKCSRVKQSDTTADSNVVKWFEHESMRGVSLYRSLQYYFSTITFQAPLSRRKIKLSIGGGKTVMTTIEFELHHSKTITADDGTTIDNALYTETGRMYVNTAELVEHINKMLKQSKTLKSVTFGLSANESRFTVHSKTARVLILHCEAAESILPLLGFGYGPVHIAPEDTYEACNEYSIGEAKYNSARSIQQTRLRQDTGFKKLLRMYNSAGYGTRKKAAKQAQKATKGSVILDDGHLVLAEYLFSLAYFAVFRKTDGYTDALRACGIGEIVQCEVLEPLCTLTGSELTVHLNSKFDNTGINVFMEALDQVSVYRAKPVDYNITVILQIIKDYYTLSKVQSEMLYPPSDLDDTADFANQTHLPQSFFTMLKQYRAESHDVTDTPDKRASKEAAIATRLQQDFKHNNVILRAVLMDKYVAEMNSIDAIEDTFYTQTDRIVSDLLNVDNKSGTGRMKVIRVYNKDENRSLQEGLRRGMEKLGFGTVGNLRKPRTFSVIGDAGIVNIRDDIETHFLNMDLSDQTASEPRSLASTITHRTQLLTNIQSKKVQQVRYHAEHHLTVCFTTVLKGLDA